MTVQVCSLEKRQRVGRYPSYFSVSFPNDYKQEIDEMKNQKELKIKS